MTVTVNPSRQQHFEEETVSLSCEGDDGATSWTLTRNTSWESRTLCGHEWGRSNGSSCTIRFPQPWDSGVYWCESGEAAVGSSVTIDITGKMRCEQNVGEAERNR